MSVWIGRRQAVGIGVESTRGVGVAPSYWLNCLSFTFADKPTRALSEASFGNITGGDQSPVTLIRAEGEFDVELGDQSWGAVLKAIFGTVATATNSPVSGANTHTFTLQDDNQHDSLTIHTIDPIGQLIYEMAMVDEVELMIEPDAIVHYRVRFISKSSQSSSGQDDSYGSEKKFVGRYLTFKVAANTASLGAASAVRLKSLTLRFQKNAEAQATLSTIQPEDIINKRFHITGEIVLNYEDRTWLNYVKDGTYKAVRIQLTHETAITGSTYYQWTLDLSKCSFEDFSPDFGMDDVVTQTLTFNALYDAGGNNNLVNSCTLINAVASY